MAHNLVQQRQVCTDMMQEVAEMVSANFSGTELANCKHLVQAIKDRVVQNEFNVKNTIKGTFVLFVVDVASPLCLPCLFFLLFSLFLVSCSFASLSLSPSHAISRHPTSITPRTRRTNLCNGAADSAR